RFDDIDAKHRDANIDQIFYYAVFYPAIEFVSAIASALIVWYGGGFVLRGTLTLGSLVAFLLYSGRFFRPISDMSEKFNTLQAAMASSERIFQLLDHQVAIQSPASSIVHRPSSIVDRPASSVDRPASMVDRPASIGQRPASRVDVPAGARSTTPAGHIVFDDVSF